MDAPTGTQTSPNSQKTSRVISATFHPSMAENTGSGATLPILWIQRGHSFKKRLAFLLSTAVGVGHVPWAPGTFGSLLAAVLYLRFGSLPVWGQFLLISATAASGIWAISVMEQHTGKHDDQRIVIDEVVGMWITLFAFPPGWFTFLAGFALFRAMDILKPFPADWVDRKWRGAKGVMFDDVVAGIYARALLFLLLRFGHLS
ncbi:MAG: phosphatidylglycerophosphatase A [Pseudomonadota bacterium]